MQRREGGQTLLELTIVVGITVIVVTALVFATIFSLRNAQLAKNQTQATKLAQEGLERVRSGRSRNLPITGIGSVTSWNGDTSGAGAIWSYTINGNCGNTTLPTPTYCYFTLSSKTSDNSLNYLAVSDKFPVSSSVEKIDQFERAIIISDGSSASEKKVTSVVKWTDAAGPHEAKVTTILGKL
ncbi:hypothetical protein HYS94_02555 [Candidatus Daviesbacteria bacterium]|nr:hypothetical protein [Candidatus Daviesbacteria bacterium]